MVRAVVEHRRRGRPARVSLRLGLGGGCADLGPRTDEFGGAILNDPIGRCVCALIEPSDDWRVQLAAPDIEVKEIIPPFGAAFEVAPGPYDVPEIAFEVERLELKLAGGKQDHDAKRVQFNNDGPGSHYA